MKHSNSTRAGIYEPQPDGYHAFIPAPLPPNPPVRIKGSLQSALSRADHALGFLNGSIQTLPKPQLFVKMYIRLEAVLSSRIEGIRSSLEEVLQVEAQLFGSNDRTDVFEIVNYISATQHGLKNIEEHPLSIPLILEIHHKLLQNTRGSRLSPGELRSSQVWIGPTGCQIHEAEFVPPPPDQIEIHMQKLEKFIEGNNELPLLVKIGLVHSQFETIHPFRDGNGRMGRLLMTLMLCKDRVLAHPVLYLSWFFNRHRQEYYDKLQSVRDQGDWEDWLLFFLRAVEEVSKHAAKTVSRVLALRESDRYVINEHFGKSASNGHRLLDHLYEFPTTSVNDVRDITKTTFATANTLISRMVDFGLLREITGRTRHRRFLLHRYVDLFEE